MQWKDYLNSDTIPWLLSSNPWTRYKTLTDLLESPVKSKEVQSAYQELIDHSLVKSLIKETRKWFPESITRHNSPVISHYQLRMLADLGFKSNMPLIKEIINNVIGHKHDSLYTIRQELPGKNFTKSDKGSNKWSALPCDSPIITYTLLEMCYDDKELFESVNRIHDKWNTKQGWFCHFFFVESQFKKLQIGCPMAGIMALEVFSKVPELKESTCSENAFAPLKFHEEQGKSIYYFGRSKKFWTLKYPFVWYNALYLIDVLSRFEFVKEEPLVKELINWILSIQDNEGRFKPTSMFKAYSKWDFANKKEPSPWITFLCCRILKRYFE